jgi:hypothetical protein
MVRGTPTAVVGLSGSRANAQPDRQQRSGARQSHGGSINDVFPPIRPAVVGLAASQ